MTHPPISLALTHHNRFHMLVEGIQSVLHDPRIAEVVISDDCSTDGSYGRLLYHFNGVEKVKLHRNERNLDCYFNKRQAVHLATCKWVILFDSDNILSPAYLDTIYKLPAWEDWTAYLPVWAQPHFDYRAFSGLTINRRMLQGFITNKTFTTALNTANYFFHRENWLSVWEGRPNPHTADSIFQNYNWLRKGGSLMFVPGLHYLHRVHPQSHYKNNWRKTGMFAKQVEQWLRLLR